MYIVALEFSIELLECKCWISKESPKSNQTKKNSFQNLCLYTKQNIKSLNKKT